MNEASAPPSLAARAVLVVAAALVYVIGVWPTRWLIRTVLNAAGDPPYQGLWKLLPHVFLYSTLAAICAAIVWFLLWRARRLEPAQLGAGRNMGTLAVLGAAGGVIAILVYFVATGQGGAIGWIPPDPWSLAGNMFSNFYEEFIFRGFILAALSRALGFWPAALLSSLAWAATHTQYPLDMRAVIAAIGVLLAWIRVRSRTIWAPYLSHMGFDIILDSLIG